MSEVEDEFLFQVRAVGLPEPQREAKIIPGRKFRFDMAWTEIKLAVEIQGGIWAGGAHATGTGLERDYEKLNLATLQGWRTLQFSTKAVKSGEAIDLTQKVYQKLKSGK